MALLILSRLTIAALGLLGVFTLYIFGDSNTLFPQMLVLQEKKLLPTHSSWSKASFPSSFVGFEPLDGLLSTLLLFFWPMVDGENPGGSIVSFVFAGQAVALWVVVVLEGFRKGNSGRLISFTTIWGLVIQSIGMAIVGPLYLTLYLFTSPLVSSTAPLTPSSLSISEGILTGIPFGTIVGYVLPTVLMSLPTPDILSINSKITAILAWQPFPLWVAVYTYVWKAVLWPKIDYKDEAAALSNQLPLLRHVYKFALALSVPAHLATATLSLATVLVPRQFTAAARQELNPISAFVPPSPISDIKAATIGQGAQWFLQYDYAIISVAFIIWAVATRYAKPVVAGSKSDSPGFGIGTVVDLLGRIVLLGPMATALTLIWERDEAVFAGAGPLAGKKTA